MIRIRSADRDDLPWLFEQVAVFGKSYPSRIGLWPYEHPEHAEAFLQKLLEDHVVLIAVDDEAPVGFIAGQLGPHPLSPDLRCLIALAWWVQAGSRNSSAGARLLDRFIEYGKEHGANWIIANTIAGFTPVKPATFERRGFRLQETAYLCEVPDRNNELRER